MNGKYKTPEAFRTAIEARAKRLRDETGEGIDMVRRKLAFEAFLCRVTVSGTPLVLKGGYLLHLRYNIGARPGGSDNKSRDDSQISSSFGEEEVPPAILQ